MNDEPVEYFTKNIKGMKNSPALLLGKDPILVQCNSLSIYLLYLRGIEKQLPETVER